MRNNNQVPNYSIIESYVIKIHFQLGLKKYAKFIIHQHPGPYLN